MKHLAKNSFINKIILAPTLLAMLSACTAKNVERNPHEAQVDSSVSSDQSKKTEVKGLNNLQIDLVKTHKILTEQNASESDLTSIESELRPTVLNISNLQDLNFIKSDKATTLLMYYNESLIKLIEKKSDSSNKEKSKFKLITDSKLKEILNTYSNTISYGCTDDLKGCQFLNFFKNDYRSSNVLLTILKNKDSEISSCKTNCDELVVDFYKNLAIAMEIKNQIKDKELDFLYIKNARSYANILNEKLKLSNSEDIKNKLSKHSAIFENIFSNFPLESTNENLQDFVKQFNPWNYSKLNKDIFPFGTKRIFDYASKYFMYETKEKNTLKLNAELKSAILNSLTNPDKVGPTFKENLNLVISENKEGLKNLGFEVSHLLKDDYYNEYFYIIDRLYRGHLGIEEASSIWNGTQKDIPQLLSKIEDYTKVSVLVMLSETNHYMLKLYSEPEGDSRTLFVDSIQKAKNLSDRWMQMFNQLDSISILLGANIQNSLNSKLDSEKIEDSKQLIASIKRNIKYLTVYPNMMLLSYFITHLDTTISVDTWFGTISIKPQIIVNSLMNGGSENPWFRFGNDENPINKYENIYALYYALNTGIFEVFSQNTTREVTKIDRVLFFEKMILQYVFDDHKDLNNNILQFKSNITNTSEFSSFERACSNINNNQLPAVNIDLEKLEFFALTGNGQNGIASYGQNFYESMVGPNTVLSSLMGSQRSGPGLESKFTLVKSMAKIIKNNIISLDNKNMTEEEKKKAIATIDEKLNEIEQTKSSYYDLVMKTHKKISSCLTKLQNLELETQNKLIDEEFKHAEIVYDKLVEQLNSNKPNFDSINKDKTLELGSAYNYDNLDHVTEQGYYYYKINLLYRMRTRLQRMGIYVNVPHDPTQISYFNKRDLIPIKDSNNKIISKEQFLKYIGLKLNGNSDAFLSWFNPLSTPEAQSNTIKSINAKTDSMIQMYIYGNQYYPKNSDNIQANEIIDEAMNLATQINIRNDEVERLKRLSINRKASNLDISKILINPVKNEKSEFFNDIFSRISENDRLISEPRELYLSIMNLGTFLFDPSRDKNTSDKCIDQDNQTDIKQILRTEYTPYALNSAVYINRFIKSVSDLKESFKSKNKLNIDIQYTLDDHYILDFSSNGLGKLIDQNKIDDYNTRMRIFKETDTKNYFSDSMIGTQACQK